MIIFHFFPFFLIVRAFGSNLWTSILKENRLDVSKNLEAPDFYNTVEIVYNDIGYNDEPDITTE